MAEDQDIATPDVQQDVPDPDQTPVPAPQDGGGPPIPQQPPTATQKLYEQLNKSQLYTKSYDDFQKQFSTPQAIDKLYQNLNESKLYTKDKESFYGQFFPGAKGGSPTASVDKGVNETTKSLQQPLQFNGTFIPDLEGEKNGLHLNDPDYQKQKADFVSRIATDPQGNLLYPEQDEKGNWQNYYTKQPLTNFDPNTMQGKVLQVPSAYLKATNGKQFITPVYDQQSNSYSFPGVQTPDVPTEQSLAPATVYGGKTIGKSIDATLPGPLKLMVDESDKQGGQLRNVIAEHPELSTDVINTLNKYGQPYRESLLTGSGAMSNILQKTVEDKYGMNDPMPANVDPEVLNGHLNILNNFEKNRNEFEANQQELQHQADLITDRAKRTGQPVSPEDADALAKKGAANLQRWNAYTKAVNYAQNYVNTPEVKDYLSKVQNRMKGQDLLNEINQRSFPNDTENQIKQDQFDAPAVLAAHGVGTVGFGDNVLRFLKTFGGRAASGISNVVTGAAMLNSPMNANDIQGLNNRAQNFIGSNLLQLSPDAMEQISKGKGGLSLAANDVASTLGGFAPYIIPGAAGEGLGAKAATFATAFAESLPTVKKEAEKAGLTGNAYNTYVAAKPLVNAAFMSLLPNVKFAKGFDNDIAKMVVDGEFNNPKQALLKLAQKVVTVHPGDVAHLQAMLSGTNLGNNIINQVTNSLQAKDDVQRGISRQAGLPVEMSNIFDPKQTATMALAGKVLEAVPTLKNAVGDFKAGKDVAETYDHIQNNLVELAANNSQGVSAKVDELLKKDPGNIYAQHLKSTLEDFAYADARMPEGIEPEQKTALFSLQQKISTLNRQSAMADPVYKPHIQKNIDDLHKQISDILKDPKKANDYLKDSHKYLTDQLQNQEPDNSNLDKKGRQKVILNHLLDNPGDVDGAFKKAGYTNMEGFWIEPGAEAAFKALSDETKAILRKHGVKYIGGMEGTAAGDWGAAGSGAVISTPDGTVRGVSLLHMGDNYSGDRHNHIAIHELGHAVWGDLPQETKDLFNDGNPLSEHGKNVQGGEGEYGKLYGKAGGKGGWQVGEEDFADQFALNKGDIDKTIQDKKDQKNSSPKTENNGKTENAPDAQAKGEMTEKPTEGVEGGNPARPTPSIESNPAYRTLDYGDNKGKDETPEAKENIKQEILNNEPVGKSGEKLRDLLTRVIPTFKKSLEEDPHNTTIVTHSSVIKAMHVWEEMGRPDISEIKGDKLKEFAQKYVDMKPEAEGKVHTFTGANGNDIKVVRHGETEDNQASEFREDNTQLTDKGETQATNAGDNLIKETGGDVPKLISSDMPRTLHTSEIIKQKLQDHALQVRGPKEVFQREQEQTGISGSGRGRVEPSQQGEEPAGESGQSGHPTEEKSKDTGKESEADDLPFIDEPGDDEFTSTKNEITKKKIEEAGLVHPMKEAAREFGTVWKDAQTKLAKGFDIEKLVKSLDDKPRAVTDLENAMILFHQNVKESQLDAANKDIAEAIDKKKPEDLADAVQRRAALLDDLQKIYNVDKKIGRETARGLNARKMMADRRFSLINMQMEKRAARGGDPLSDAEMKELQKQHDDIKAAKDAVDARVAELEKENARLKAQQSVSSAGKTGRVRKNKEQFKEERKNIVQKMRADLLKAAKGGEGLTSSVPGAAQLKAVAPHIKDLVKSFIEEGVDKLEDITKNIMDILKPEIPGLEERHVHDLIAGVYNEPQEGKEPSTYQNIKAQAKGQKYNVGDPKLLKLQADYERSKDKFTQGLKVDQRKAQTNFQKVQNVFLKYERATKLSNPITLGKLVSAALTRLATTPLEEGVGAVYSKMLPGLAKKAPGEAGINVGALAKGYKAAFMRGLDDAAIVAKGGKTDIEAVFGKGEQLPPEALDFFGQLHSAIKAPVKRFAFERSFQKRLANNIKNGTSIDAITEARIAVEAYKDAERSIFMQDNFLSKGWTNMMASWERGGPAGETAATIGRWLLPFVKIPTNIVGETIQHVAGPELALTQVIAKSLGSGLKNLSQDEAESIMRNLKKGSIGHVAMMAGYLNPQVFGGYYQQGEKRDQKDVKAGDMRIDGVNIPAWALEAPVFQAMQIGATVRRIADTKVKGQEKGLGAGIFGGAMGLMSHEPLLDEPGRISDALKNPSSAKYFFGELAKSTLVPAAAEYAAKVLDPADTRSIGEKALEPENKRQPGTIVEHVESGVPGLRENVPIKKPKPTGHRQRQRR